MSRAGVWASFGHVACVCSGIVRRACTRSITIGSGSYIGHDLGLYMAMLCHNRCGVRPRTIVVDRRSSIVVVVVVVVVGLGWDWVRLARARFYSLRDDDAVRAAAAAAAAAARARCVAAYSSAASAASSGTAAPRAGALRSIISTPAPSTSAESVANWA